MPAKSRKEEYSEATRDALIEAARKLFEETSYADTSIEQIVQHARVTRGALYHHFTSKRDLFQAAYEQIHLDIMSRMRGAVDEIADSWERALGVIETYLDSCLDPRIQRNIMHQAPSVLGWETWRKLEARHGLSLVESLLQHLVDEGIMRPHRVDVSAPMILAVVNEAGMMVAASVDAKTVRRELEPILQGLLNGLRADAK